MTNNPFLYFQLQILECLIRHFVSLNRLVVQLGCHYVVCSSLTKHITLFPHIDKTRVIQMVSSDSHKVVNYVETSKLEGYRVQPLAAGCIIFWGRGFASDGVPSITSVLVLISPTSEA